MKRLAEIIYIVPEEREAYLESHLHPTEEIQQILWMHGVRNQNFFVMNELVLVTFEYHGKNLNKDMDEIAAYDAIKEHLISKRRRDVPEEERATTSWWAPLKKLGAILSESPMPDDDDELSVLEENYHSMISGGMKASVVHTDISFDEDDWSESLHI